MMEMQKLVESGAQMDWGSDDDDEPEDLPMEQAQTDLAAAVLERDLETIAEYIVHLKED